MAYFKIVSGAKIFYRGRIFDNGAWMVYVLTLQKYFFFQKFLLLCFHRKSYGGSYYYKGLKYDMVLYGPYFDLKRPTLPFSRHAIVVVPLSHQAPNAGRVEDVGHVLAQKPLASRVRGVYLNYIITQLLGH